MSFKNICALCHRPIAPKSRVKVCAVCGAVYHKECFEASGGCVVHIHNSNMGEPYAYFRQGFTRCPVCSLLNERSSLFCPRCLCRLLVNEVFSFKNARRGNFMEAENARMAYVQKKHNLLYEKISLVLF